MPTPFAVSAIQFVVQNENGTTFTLLILISSVELQILIVCSILYSNRNEYFCNCISQWLNGIEIVSMYIVQSWLMY